MKQRSLKLLLLIIFINFFGYDRVSGREPESKGKECASIKNTSNSPIDIMCEQHIALMRSFVNNLKDRRTNEVVRQIAYPLIFWKKGNKLGVLSNPRQLVKYYDHVFPEQIVSKISTAFKNDTKYFWNDRGMMFGGGSAWFNKESGNPFIGFIPRQTKICLYKYQR